MIQAVSHDIQEESPEAKARWFQSLTPAERIALFCQFTDRVLENNPQIVEREAEQPTARRIRIVSNT